MSRTLHLFGTDWCAMMVPIQVIRWYRMQCYDGTDSCAIVVPIRRYCHVADIYSQMMGLNKSLPLSFYYLFHTIGAIRTASQAENYAACNLWLKEIRQVLVYPEQVSIPVTSKKQLLYDLMQIKSTEQIVGLNEVIELIMHIKEIPDPIS